LQDHKRAAIIGERTWGKGSVQNVIELEGGKSALKLTTAGYQRPSGKNIHRSPDAKDSDEWGVSPNDHFEVKLDELEMARLVDYRRRRDILAVNHSAEPVDAEKPADKSPDSAKSEDQKPADKKSADTTPEDGKSDDKKSEDHKPADEKSNDKKPHEDKPDVQKPDEKKPDDADSEHAQPETEKSKSPDAAADTPQKKVETTEPEHAEHKRPGFVDRQLQKALDYLNGELAKAG